MTNTETTTLIQFYIEPDGTILAIWPREFYNLKLYGTGIVNCYSSNGQHSQCSRNYFEELPLASYKQSKQLRQELESIGYQL